MPHDYSCIMSSLNLMFILFPPIICEDPRYFLVFKVISWVFLLFTVIVGPLSIVVKDTVFDSTPTSSKVVYNFSFVFLYVANIYISGFSLFKHGEFRRLLKDVLLEATSGKEFLTHCAAFLIVHLLNTICMLLTQLTRTENIYYYLTVFFVDGFLTFRLISGLFIIFILINNIIKKFRLFNDSLLRRNDTSAVKHYRLLHNELCDHVQAINRLFGVILLLIIFYFINSFLRHAVFISLNYGMNLVAIVRCLWILSYGFQAAYLAHIGEQISNETQRTVSICYKLMSKMSFADVYGHVNSELFLLAQQALNRSVKISAAGFFNVDNSMILFMATTFFTYFIVVMQLLSGRNSQ